MNAPCWNCPNRSESCHATCDDYKDFALEKKRENDVRKQQAAASAYFIAGAAKCARQKRRRK